MPCPTNCGEFYPTIAEVASTYSYLTTTHINYLPFLRDPSLENRLVASMCPGGFVAQVISQHCRTHVVIFRVKTGYATLFALLFFFPFIDFGNITW